MTFWSKRQATKQHVKYAANLFKTYIWIHRHIHIQHWNRSDISGHRKSGSKIKRTTNQNKSDIVVLILGKLIFKGKGSLDKGRKEGSHYL